MIRLLAALAFTFALAACNDGGGSAPPAGSGLWQTGPVLNGVNRSVGMPATFATGQAVSFPASPGKVGYVTQACGGNILGKTVRLTIEIAGTGVIEPSDGAVKEPRLRLYFQRAGDNYSGMPPYNSYRQWSANYIALTPGTHTISAPVQFSNWINVQGQRDKASFEAAAQNCANVGFTFGGQFAGHGVYLKSGQVTFRVVSFSVR